MISATFFGSRHRFENAFTGMLWIGLHLTAGGMFGEFLYKVEHTAVHVALAEDGDEAVDVTAHPKALSISGNEVLAGELRRSP